MGSLGGVPSRQLGTYHSYLRCEASGQSRADTRRAIRLWSPPTPQDRCISSARVTIGPPRCKTPRLQLSRTNHKPVITLVCTMGRFIVVTIAFLTGLSVARSVRSPAPLTPLPRSAALRFATLISLARSIHGLTHFAHSLVGRLKFMNLCSR